MIRSGNTRMRATILISFQRRCHYILISSRIRIHVPTSDNQRKEAKLLSLTLCDALSSIHEPFIHFLWPSRSLALAHPPLAAFFWFLIYLIFVHFIRSICAPVASDNGHIECAREKFPLRHTCTAAHGHDEMVFVHGYRAPSADNGVPHARRTN